MKKKVERIETDSGSGVFLAPWAAPLWRKINTADTMTKLRRGIALAQDAN